MNDQTHHNTNISVTGFSWAKEGVGLQFHADTSRKKILLIGNKTIDLSVSETRELVNLINQLIDLVEENQVENTENDLIHESV